MKRKFWFFDSADEGKDLGGSPFADLLDEEGAEEPSVEAPAETPPVTPPVTPPKEDVPAAPAPPKEEVPPPTPPVTPGGEVPAPPATTPAPKETPATPAPTQEQLAELRKKAKERLQAEYALTPELAAQLATEPEVVIPQLLADVHLRVQDKLLEDLQGAMPGLFRAVADTDAAERSAKAAFFSQWPGLAEHEREVLVMGETFRKANAKAPPQEAIERIGQMTALALGLDPNTLRTKEAPPPPAAPATPRRPSGLGGSTTPRPPAGETNVFTQLANEGDDE